MSKVRLSQIEVEGRIGTYLFIIWRSFFDFLCPWPFSREISTQIAGDFRCCFRPFLEVPRGTLRRYTLRSPKTEVEKRRVFKKNRCTHFGNTMLPTRFHGQPRPKFPFLFYVTFRNSILGPRTVLTLSV